MLFRNIFKKKQSEPIVYKQYVSDHLSHVDYTPYNLHLLAKHCKEDKYDEYKCTFQYTTTRNGHEIHCYDYFQKTNAIHINCWCPKTRKAFIKEIGLTADLPVHFF